MDSNEVKKDTGHSKKKYTLGVVVIIGGFLLLLSNFGIFSDEFRHVLFSWQSLLIAIGIVSLFTSESRTPGTILILIGAIFIIPRIFDLPFNIMNVFWPIILIGIGVLILTRKIPHRSWHKERHQATAPEGETTFTGSENLQDGFIHQEYIFSGGEHRIQNQVFRGGHINCIFGGAEIDLTQTTLADGINELEITTVFGGVTLIVPADWKLQLKTTSILGAFSDKRAYVREAPDSSRILIIKGSTIFGGGEVKSF